MLYAVKKENGTNSVPQFDESICGDADPSSYEIIDGQQLTIAENCQMLCKECNRRKSGK